MISLLEIAKARFAEHFQNNRMRSVLEIMAGNGRNIPVLGQYFEDITVVEQSKYLTNHIKRMKANVDIKTELIQDLDWEQQQYRH